jgi:hypothetical protein
MPRDNKESGSIFLGLGVHNFGGYLALYFGNNWIVCRFMDFNFLTGNGVNEMESKEKHKVHYILEVTFIEDGHYRVLDIIEGFSDYETAEKAFIAEAEKRCLTVDNRLKHFGDRGIILVALGLHVLEFRFDPDSIKKNETETNNETN